MRNVCLVMAFVGLASGVPAAAAADEVVEQIDASKAYYADGDLARALTELELALNALRTEFSLELMAILPKPPALWSAGEPELESGAAMFGSGLMITRRYEEQKGRGRITAELMVDSPMVQAFSAVFSLPVMIANDPGLERIRFGETNAVLKWDADRRAGRSLARTRWPRPRQAHRSGPRRQGAVDRTHEELGSRRGQESGWYPMISSPAAGPAGIRDTGCNSHRTLRSIPEGEG